jgi:nucleoside-diphosphate-sugar epimerase
MRYLVTGGAGFIGSHIAQELVKQGHQVKILDNFSTGSLQNIEAIQAQVDLIEGSILETSLLDRIFPSLDVVIHQAAIPSVPLSLQKPLESHQANATGTLQLLEMARKHQVKRFVYASSSSVYGESPVLPKKETMTPEPLSPYAVNKLCGEYYCRVYANLYALETVCLRYFNVFGPRQNPDSPYAAVIPKFISALLQKQSPIIYGDGEQSRDFTYIDNVVEANICASQHPGLSGEVFNVAGGQEAVTLNQLLKKLNFFLNSSIKPRYEPPRSGDVKHSLADMSALEHKLALKNKINFDEGLRRTLAWFQAQAQAQLFS